MVGLSHRARQRSREAWEDYRTIDHRTTDTRFSFFAFQFARLPRHPFARNLIVSLSAFQFFRFSGFQHFNRDFVSEHFPTSGEHFLDRNPFQTFVTEFEAFDQAASFAIDRATKNTMAFPRRIPETRAFA